LSNRIRRRRVLFKALEADHEKDGAFDTQSDNVMRPEGVHIPVVMIEKSSAIPALLPEVNIAIPPSKFEDKENLMSRHWTFLMTSDWKKMDGLSAESLIKKNLEL